MMDGLESDEVAVWSRQRGQRFKREVWEKWAEITLTNGRGRVVIGSDEPPDEGPTLECFSTLK
jgi:hypothetical protein